MDRKKLNVYVASSVGIDYYFFLGKMIHEAGFNVKLLYLIGEETYRNQAQKAGLTKLLLRIQMYVLYPAYLLLEGLRCQKDCIFIVSSNTFYAPYLVYLFLSRRNVKVIHMLYDLYPDALEIASGLSPKSWLSQLLGSITHQSQSRCDATVYLGNFLKKHAEKRWGNSKCSKVIDISTDLTLYSNQLPIKTINDAKLIIHYGGQLGHLHDATSIIESVKYLNQTDIAENIKFIFYVSGSQAEFLNKELRSYPVEICSTASSKQWRYDIQNFHIGLVSLSPGGASVCLPSKTYAMMAGGLAIIAIAPLWSDLGIMINQMNSGWVINNSTHLKEPTGNESEYLQALRESRESNEIAVEFYELVKSIIFDKSILDIKRKNAFLEVRKRYNSSNLQEDWRELICSLESNMKDKERDS